MKDFEYTIKDELGIHARPAGVLVKEAMSFESEILIECREKSVSAKKLFRVMSLNVKKGETVIVKADGPDENQAIESIGTLMRKIM